MTFHVVADCLGDRRIGSGFAALESISLSLKRRTYHTQRFQLIRVNTIHCKTYLNNEILLAQSQHQPKPSIAFSLVQQPYLLTRPLEYPLSLSIMIKRKI
jgi:hypothetical protein